MESKPEEVTQRYIYLFAFGKDPIQDKDAILMVHQRTPPQTLWTFPRSSRRSHSTGAIARDIAKYFLRTTVERSRLIKITGDFVAISDTEQDMIFGLELTDEEVARVCRFESKSFDLKMVPLQDIGTSLKLDEKGLRLIEALP